MGINEIIKIGTKIKEKRKSKGISQKEMAKMLDIPYSTYSNYENNNREPGLEVLTKIINILNLDFEELLSYSDKLIVESDKNPESEKFNKLVQEIESRLYLKKWIKETDLSTILEELFANNKDLARLDHYLLVASQTTLDRFNLLSDSKSLTADEMKKIHSEHTNKLRTIQEVRNSYVHNIIDKILLLIDIEEKNIKATIGFDEGDCKFKQDNNEII